MWNRRKGVPPAIAKLAARLNTLIKQHEEISITDLDKALVQRVLGEIGSLLNSSFSERKQYVSSAHIDLLAHRVLIYLITHKLISRNPRFEEAVREFESSSPRHDQLGHETSDGGKYLGILVRDAGSFGSLPLYDDYSEEGDS